MVINFPFQLLILNFGSFASVSHFGCVCITIDPSEKVSDKGHGCNTTWKLQNINVQQTSPFLFCVCGGWDIKELAE